MAKEPYKPSKRQFNLKFLLCGDSKSGKTHLISTYEGPIHFYMLDKGGQRTIDKMLITRPKSAAPITVDLMAGEDWTFSKIWKQFQVDEKAGFFNEMAEKNGLVVIDSLTSANEKAIREILKLNSVSLNGPGVKHDNRKGMSQPLWSQLESWIMNLIIAAQSMPCASCCTVHLHSIFNDKQELVKRYPMVNGQLRQKIAKDYDEVYLLDTFGKKRRIILTEKDGFQAGSRSFNCTQFTNVTMQELATAYMNNDLLDTIK